MSKLITKGLGDGQLLSTKGLGIFIKIALTSYKKFESPYDLLSRIYFNKPESFVDSSRKYKNKPESFVSSSRKYKRKERYYS